MLKKRLSRPGKESIIKQENIKTEEEVSPGIVPCQEILIPMRINSRYDSHFETRY